MKAVANIGSEVAVHAMLGMSVLPATTTINADSSYRSYYGSYDWYYYLIT